MKRFLPALLCCLAFSACDLDLFHKGERRVAGIYELSKAESGNYYLIRKQDVDQSGTGLVEGTVTRIGWSKTFILVERKASFGGDKDGWMIIDVTKQSMTGPFIQDELRLHPEVSDIRTLPPDKAWDSL